MKYRIVLVACVLCIGIPAAAKHSSKERDRDYDEVVAAEQQAVDKTQRLLEEKLKLREGEVRSRARAMYKLARSSWPRVWFEPKSRQRAARWIGAARRIARRDRYELELLRDELAATQSAEAHLRGRRDLNLPAERAALVWPVAEHEIARKPGLYRGPTRRVQLRQRGLLLSTEPGVNVRSPGAGLVRYVGPLSGFGDAIVVEHEECTSIIAGLQNISVAIGDRVEAEDALAQAASGELYLETRLKVGALGHAVDPRRLLID